MATDYDTPRKTDEELHEESLEELKAKRVDAQSGQIDVDEAEAAENLELPGADLSGEEQSMAESHADRHGCSEITLGQSPMKKGPANFHWRGLFLAEPRLIPPSGG